MDPRRPDARLGLPQGERLGAVSAARRGRARGIAGVAVSAMIRRPRLSFSSCSDQMLRLPFFVRAMPLVSHAPIVSEQAFCRRGVARPISLQMLRTLRTSSHRCRHRGSPPYMNTGIHDPWRSGRLERISPARGTAE